MIKELKLTNYRNYEHLSLSFPFNKGIFYVSGDNAQGKTNLIESIYLLALAKPFRQTTTEKLIKWDSPFARINGVAEVEGKNTELEVFLGKSPNPKQAYKLNDVKISAANFLANLKVVLFQPEDLNILYLGPELRRRYLDILLVQNKRNYYLALRNFKKIKEQRNALLTSIKNAQSQVRDLALWDQQLIKAAAVVWRERAETLNFYQNNLTDYYRKISGGDENLRLEYINSLNLNPSDIISHQDLEALYSEKLEMSRDRDIASTHTQFGPHRDDIAFKLADKAILEHASRGEFRTILLTLKLIEMKFMSQGEERPILLMDDVFSELDRDRQNLLLDEIADFQSFITSTHDPYILEQVKKGSNNICADIKSGRLNI